jgi:hypothetical protein
VGARAPFGRSWLAATEALSKKCQRVVVLISVPCDRIRGLDASLHRDSSVDLSFSLEYVWGCLERVARALALYERVPSCP